MRRPRESARWERDTARLRSTPRSRTTAGLDEAYAPPSRTIVARTNTSSPSSSRRACTRALPGDGAHVVEGLFTSVGHPHRAFCGEREQTRVDLERHVLGAPNAPRRRRARDAPSIQANEARRDLTKTSCSTASRCAARHRRPAAGWLGPPPVRARLDPACRARTGRRRRRPPRVRIAVLDEHVLDHIPSSMELAPRPAAGPRRDR